MVARYAMVRRSAGNHAMVAPYSGAMLATVARSGTDKEDRPGPWNSTMDPTTFSSRSRSAKVRARSEAKTPGASRPVSSTPTTCGTRIMMA
ncbi:hypothetical protein SHIRM173S_09979 [Streptomyces hirsutus]